MGKKCDFTFTDGVQCLCNVGIMFFYLTITGNTLSAHADNIPVQPRMTPFKYYCLYGRNSTTPPPSTTTASPSQFNITPLFRRRRFAGGIPRQFRNTTEQSTEVRDRSTCSWRLERDENNTRIPQVMYRAVCKNETCDHSFMEEAKNAANEDNFTFFLNFFRLKTVCAIVYEPRTIFVEHCNNGNYFCTRETEPWPVACTCALKNIVTVEPQG
ncbi:hypothetical protein ACF0H5_005396 [Mactra antiquata]